MDRKRLRRLVPSLRSAATELNPLADMDLKTTLETFSINFIKKPYNHRCVHDGLKKPEKLMAKICHRISDVFKPQFENISIRYNQKGECYLFNLIGHVEETTWEKAMTSLKMGGGGYLIIEKGSGKFYAESEGEPPPEQYAGCWVMLGRAHVNN